MKFCHRRFLAGCDLVVGALVLQRQMNVQSFLQIAGALALSILFVCSSFISQAAAAAPDSVTHAAAFESRLRLSFPVSAATYQRVVGESHANVSFPFEDWLKSEAQISFAKMMANVSPAQTAPGSVVASPSKVNPDYWFTWVRDSALVMHVVVENYATSQGADKARWFRVLSDYSAFSRRLQQSDSLSGLGEPKFNADGSNFSGPWGRPQNDSPALRAMTLSQWATYLIADNQTDFVRQNLYASEIPATKVIKADLEYVAYHWRDSSFDLWEEVRGDHFYTRMVQLAALRAGAKLALQLGDWGAATFYAQQADEVSQSINSFWDDHRSTFLTTLNRVDGISYKHSNLDAALVLGVLHSNFVTGSLSPMDERVMATASQVEASMASIYPINNSVSGSVGGLINDSTHDPISGISGANRFTGVAPAIGRYPEDTFSGQDGIYIGNPWVLNTAAFAELYYKVASGTRAQGNFTVTARNLLFVRNATGPTLGTGSLVAGLILTKGTAEFQQLVQKFVDRGDAFMSRVRLHENPDGSLSEQIDRNNGYMCSAHDLTWSYAAFITAYWSRP